MLTAGLCFSAAIFLAAAVTADDISARAQAAFLFHRR